MADTEMFECCESRMPGLATNLSSEDIMKLLNDSIKPDTDGINRLIVHSLEKIFIGKIIDLLYDANAEIRREREKTDDWEISSLDEIRERQIDYVIKHMG